MDLIKVGCIEYELKNSLDHNPSKYLMGKYEFEQNSSNLFKEIYFSKNKFISPYRHPHSLNAPSRPSINLFLKKNYFHKIQKNMFIEKENYPLFRATPLRSSTNLTLKKLLIK